MNLRTHIKFLSVISIISIALVIGIISTTQNAMLAVIVSMLADSIQLVTYIIWLFQQETQMVNVPTQVKEVHVYVTQEKERSRVREQLISRLVKEGVVKESELFSLIRNKEIIIAFPYAEGIKGKVLELTNGQPLANILKQIGFVRVALYQNLMATMADNLPKNLRDIENLNAFIKRELPKEWKRISQEVKNRYPAEKYHIYEKWRTGEGFGVTYILAKSMAQDFLIDYLNKNSFTTEFRNHIAGRIDRNRLKSILRRKKHKVIEIVSKISIDFLLGDIPRNVRDSIVNKEDEIKKAMSVKVITDYRLLELTKLADTLRPIIPKTEELMAKNYSEIIINESQKCYQLLKELGIDLG